MQHSVTHSNWERGNSNMDKKTILVLFAIFVACSVYLSTLVTYIGTVISSFDNTANAQDGYTYMGFYNLIRVLRVVSLLTILATICFALKSVFCSKHNKAFALMSVIGLLLLVVYIVVALVFVPLDPSTAAQGAMRWHTDSSLFTGFRTTMISMIVFSGIFVGCAAPALCKKKSA